jgi:hypothetical protein
MLVAAVTIGIGLVCLYYGARSLRVGRALRRLRSHDRDPPSNPADRMGKSEEIRDTPDRAFPEGGSIERGFVLLVLGALCVLFGVIAL